MQCFTLFASAAVLTSLLVSTPSTVQNAKDSPCEELDKLIAAAQADVPFSSLAPSLTNGRRLVSYSPDASLGSDPSKSCSINMQTGIGQVITCEMVLPNDTEGVSLLSKVRQGQRELTEIFGACPGLDGAQVDAPEIQTSKWTVADRKVDVILATERSRLRRPPMFVTLKVVRNP